MTTQNLLLAWTVILVLFSIQASAQDNPYRVLPDDDTPIPNVPEYLNDCADRLLHENAAERDALNSPDELAAYQKKQREFFERQLGGFQKRTPLNAQVVGKLERDAFTVEKIIFESRPNFFVTAVLYLPKGGGPFPGVLMPCGHSANGKAEEAYQRVCILLALNGMAALCYDPIGQGERAQILKDDGTQLLGSTLEHTMVGVGSILVGHSTATYRIYDGMRAIDYLTERPEIDPTRIGCTGNSGGGTLTSFLMSLDDRIACAAPSCYLTSFERLLDTEGPQDAEQNWYGQIAGGFDHSEYIITRAPKPTLICCATQDFFDIEGTWDTFRAAKRWYTKLGYPERVSLVEVDEHHGFTQGLREAAVAWMARWLLHRDEPVREPAFDVFTDADLQCTPDGQVLLVDGAVSVFDINAERGDALRETRKELHKNLTDSELLEAIKETVGFLIDDDLPAITVYDRDENTAKGVRIDRCTIQPEDKSSLLPAIVLVPDNPSGERYLIVHGEGKAAALKEGGEAWALARQGHTVMAIDLSGIGEVETPENYKGWAEYFSRDWQDYFAAYLIGKSFVGMRAEEVLYAARILQQYDGTTLQPGSAPEKNVRPIHIVGAGEAAVPVLHAAAFEPERFASVKLEDDLDSWTGLLTQRVTHNQLFNAVHNALLVYDLPDLRAMLTQRGLLK